MQTRKNVKIGNSTCTDTANVEQPGCRPKNQWEAVMNHHKKYPSAFWCSDPFTPEPDGRIIRSWFVHLYYDTEGRMQSLMVYITGKVEYTPSERSAEPSVVADTLKEYGSFHG